MPHESPPERSYAVLTSPSQVGRQRVGMLSELPALLRRLGVEPADVLASAGLTPEAIDGPERQIAYAAFGRLLAESANRTHCAHLGLLAGRMWRIADLGLLGELARQAPTVGEALHTLAVSQHLNSEGGLVYLNAGDEMAELGYAIYLPGVSGVDQIYDGAIAAAFNCVRELCGPGWRPTEVLFAHARPDDPSPYRDLFRVMPRFNAEVSALRFPAHWLTKPIDGADDARRRRAQQRADEAGRGQIVEQVRRTLRVLLLRGLHAGDDVAQMLSMHRRTLNRRIKAEGTTFQRLLDEVRFSVARQLLAGTDISLDDIAAMLGYSGVSPFMRAFRRWTGSTPGGWRRSLGIGRPADSPAAGGEGPGERLGKRVGSAPEMSGRRAPRSIGRMMTAWQGLRPEVVDCHRAARAEHRNRGHAMFLKGRRSRDHRPGPGPVAARPRAATCERRHLWCGSWRYASSQRSPSKQEAKRGDPATPAPRLEHRAVVTSPSRHRPTPPRQAGHRAAGRETGQRNPNGPLVP